MPETVTLPRKVQNIFDNIEQITKKIEAMRKIGGDTGAVEGQLQAAMKDVLAQLALEAQHEIVDLGKAAPQRAHRFSDVAAADLRRDLLLGRLGDRPRG